MDFQTVGYEVRAGVAWITLNRPDAFNSINLECARELAHVANICGSDPGVRAAVLTGAGDKAFCAGGDVPSFAANPKTVDVLLKEVTGYLHLAVSRLAWMNPPLIAAVNGVAAGAGLSLVAFCDLAVASDAAKFTSAYTQIGYTPDGSNTYYLSRLIGVRRAMEMYLTNQVITARQALDWGLVNKVVAPLDLIPEVEALAAKLAQGPTKTFGAVKKLVLLSANDSLESQMEREARTIAAMSLTEDGLEGVKAFAEKRKAVFVGR
ncbi:enoyl-CoA hydratase-related protein [Fundidesulfovibrio butyratiphilus]